MVRTQDGCGRVRAFFERCGERRFATIQLIAFHHAHHAVVFAMLPAARRQIRLTSRGHREERRDERQAEDGKQRNG
jgi:hypothetical protein